MYNVSDRYKQVIRDICVASIQGTITFSDGSVEPFNDTTIDSGSLSISYNSVSGDILEFGAVPLGELNVRVISKKSRYVYQDAIIRFDCLVDLRDGTFETIPMGVWNVAETEKATNRITLTAYDNLLFAEDLPYDLSITGYPANLMQLLAEDCGLELDDSIISNNYPNSTAMLTLNTDSGCSNYRQAMGAIAQMCGCFVTATRDGKVAFRQFSTEPIVTISRGQRYSSTIADYKCGYDYLRVIGAKGKFTAGKHIKKNKKLKMIISDAPGWDFGTKEVLQARVEELFEYLQTIDYTPANISMFSDPALDCGDMIELLTTDTPVNMIVTSIDWQYNGAMTVDSVGNNPYLTKQSQDTSGRTPGGGGGGGEGGDFIYHVFRNGSPVSVSGGVPMTTLATVSFATTAETSASFHGNLPIKVRVLDETITFTAYDADGNTKEYSFVNMQSDELYIQYFMDDTPYSALFTETLINGEHLISLYYPLLGLHGNASYTFEVRIGIKNGSAAVGLGEFVGTISGQGLSTAEIWDGRINISDETHRVQIEHYVPHIVPVDDVMLTSQTIDKVSVVSEEITSFIIDGNVPIVAPSFTESIETASLTKSKTVSVKNSRWDYDAKYINKVDNVLSLKTDYLLLSDAEPIDYGSVQCVSFDTREFVDVTSLEVLEVEQLSE